jgi:hypothetical protein
MCHFFVFCEIFGDKCFFGGVFWDLGKNTTERIFLEIEKNYFFGKLSFLGKIEFFGEN